MAKRRFTELLPYIHQTETLKKFFGATVDHLFQPGTPESLSGYIGQKPSYYDPTKDFYIPEPTAKRQAYQLEPAMVSRATDGSVSQLYFYDDLIDYLKSNRGNVVDHNRLFSDEFYPWAPPLDIDKIVNFSQYTWFGDEPDLIPVLHLYTTFTTTIANGVDSAFFLPPALDIDVSRETPMVYVDGQRVEFELSSDRSQVLLTVVPPERSKVVVFRYGDLKQTMEGATAFDVSPFNNSGVALVTSNMRVRLHDGVNYYAGWDAGPLATDADASTVDDAMPVFSSMPWDNILLRYPRGQFDVPDFADRPWDADVVEIPWDEALDLREFFIEGVGTSILFIPFNAEPVGQDLPVHVVIDRRSRDQNPWSRINYWVHRDSYRWSGQTFLARRGIRPIVEFVPNIELYNYGFRRLPDVSALSSDDPLELPFILDRPDTPGAVSDWAVQIFDELPYESSGFVQIPLADVNGEIMGTVYVDNGHYLRFGDRVLVLNNPNSQLNHRILTVARSIGQKTRYRTESEYDLGTTGFDSVGFDTVYSIPEQYTAEVMVLEIGEAPRLGDMVRKPVKGVIPWDGKDPYDNFGFEFSNEPVEFYFNGTEWVVAQGRRGGDPLFNLYTVDGIAHGALPSSTFAGNRLFGFAEGDGTTKDRILDRVVKFDSFGQIVFENDQETRRATSAGATITGFQFYKIKGETSAEDTLHNSWKNSYRKSTQTLSSEGFYDVPMNLRANPDNEVITFVSRNQFFEHFTTTIAAQEPFVGSPYRGNNWRDGARDMGKGYRVVQNRSPLLKTMLLASDSRFDYFDALRFIDLEYTRFRVKFIAQIDEVRRSGQNLDTDAPDAWVETILENLRFAKTSEFPFALSTVAGGQYFIPPTAACLGLLPPVVPGIETDDTYLTPVKMVRGHDGSRTPTLGDFDDAILLALEQRIYANIASRFRTEASFEFDLWNLLPGRNRVSGPNTARYSRPEVVDLLTPAFLSWATKNNYDYRVNDGYSSDDPFSWNWRDLPDRDGVGMPGHWRAIYRYYFDTDRPHLVPWEMLGFASKPEWWEAEYGAAPYTRGNTKLWEDIRDGRILRGPRQGIDERFVRPDLFTYLPVDDEGGLLDPIAANIMPQQPTYSQATREWKVGDHGPVENLFINSTSFGFAKALLGYMMRPAEWIEVGWDTLRRGSLDDEQWYNTYYKDRPRSASIYVHGEIGPTGAVTRVIGVQQWISDMMVSRAQDPAILGEAVRGLEVRLAHKMAGFTQVDNLRAFADNFGLVPGEDLEVVLHRSPPIKESTYSGLMIEWTGDGYRVIGYDRTKETFKIVKGNQYGQKKVISLDEQPPIYEWRAHVYYPVNRLVEYNKAVYRCVSSHTSGNKFEDEFWKAEPTLAGPSKPRVIVTTTPDEGDEVTYYTEYSDVQTVSEFITDYARWLEQEGWVFDATDPDTGEIQDWDAAILEFLKWAQMDWQPGNFIVLSPGASQLKYVTSHGFVLNMEEYANGIYGLVDRTGRPIARRDTFVSRLDEETKIICRTDDLFGARVRVAEEEHVLLFENLTKFGDVIYDPLFDMRQPRLRLIGMRAQPWAGRHDAPGYVLEGNNLRFSYEHVTANVRNMFEVERSDDHVFRDYTRHVIGYQTRDYLDNLLLSETSQFEFYQGMIQQKGAPGVFDKLTRSQFIDQNRDLKFSEEWGFHLGRFGASERSHTVSFKLARPDIRTNPQLIQFGMDDEQDAIVGVTDSNGRWIEPPKDTTNIFPVLEGRGQNILFRGFDQTRWDTTAFDPFYHSTLKPPPFKPLPTGGYVRPAEINYVAFSFDLLPTLLTNLDAVGREIEPYNRIWVMSDAQSKWNVMGVVPLTGDALKVQEFMTPTEDSTLEDEVRIVFNDAHFLTDRDVGEYLFIKDTTDVTPDIRGFLQISAVEDIYNLRVRFVATKGIDYSENGGVGAPDIFILRPRRFNDEAQRNTWYLTYKIAKGEHVYVDHIDGGTWGVYTLTDTGWTLVRVQPPRPDPTAIDNALAYDLATRMSDMLMTPEPILIDTLTVLDPVMGLLPGNAAKELTYVLEDDPAVYLTDSASKWSEAQVGKLWWDTSSVRFMEALTDITDSDDAARNAAEWEFRTNNWARLVPGSRVDIYEWTRSTVPPAAYTDAVAKNAVDYVVADQFDSETGQTATYYYFWARNPTVTPEVPNRSMSGAQVASVITSPKSNDIPWVAAIAPNALLVSGIEQYLTTDTSAFTFEVVDTDYEGVEHNEWTLVRKNDERGLPPTPVWDRLRASLVSFDDETNPVPDLTLPERHRTGIAIRPRQSMFTWPDADLRSGLLAGRRSFVEAINAIFARTDRLVQDTNLRANLTLSTPVYETLIRTKQAGESRLPLPPSNTYKYEVFSIVERNYLLNRPEFMVARGFVPYDTTAWDADGFDQTGTITADRDLRILVRNDDGFVPSWSVWEIDPDAPSFPTNNEFLRLAKSYDLTVASYADLADLADTGGVEPHQRVLVVSDETLDGFWAVYSYEPDLTTDNGFLLEYTQTYRTTDFWSEIDWFADGYVATSPPIIHYATTTERDQGELPDPQNTFVQVDDDGNGAWIWTVWNGTSWDVVARENGTVAFSPAFYDAARVVYYGDGTDTANLTIRDGSFELQVLIDSLYDAVLTTGEINELFFSMLHHIHTQQEQVDWAFKTSFLTVQGINEALTQTPIATYDITDALLSYVDEVKPYRVVTRDYTRSLAPPLDQANVHVADFDKPLYLDPKTNTYRRLNPSDPVDLAIIQNNVPWSEWYAVFNNTSYDPASANFNPVRRLNLTVRFDRVESGPVPQWRPDGWDVLGFDLYGFDSSTIPGYSTTTALTRLIDYYSPTEGMVEKNAEELLDLGFKGVQLDGGDFFEANGPASEWDVRGFDTLALDGIILSEDDAPVDGNDVPPNDVLINPDERDYGLIDPYHAANRPEELAYGRAADGLIMTVSTRWTIGAPNQATSNLNTARLRRNQVTLSYEGLAYDAESIFVYRDGVRGQQDIDYTVDLFLRTVTVNLITTAPRTKSVSVHVIGTAGSTAIIEQRFFTGTGSDSFTLDTAPTGIVDVVVDGVFIDPSEITVDWRTVTLATAPAVGADVQITSRDKASDFDVAGFDLNDYEIATSDLSPIIRTRREVLDWNASQVWTLSYPTLDLHPEHVGTILEVDGERFLPPFTNYGRFDANNRQFGFFQVNDINNVRVWFGGVEYDRPIGYIRHVGNQTFATISDGLGWDETALASTPNGPFLLEDGSGTLLMEDGSGDLLTEIADFGFDTQSFDPYFDIAVVDENIVAIDDTLNIQNVIACLFEGHDYEVNDGILTVLRPIGLSTLDDADPDLGWDEYALDQATFNVRIEVTTFETVGPMQLETYVLRPNGTGDYALDATIPDESCAMVWVGGLFRAPNIDYQLHPDPTWNGEGRPYEWDEEGFDIYGLDGTIIGPQRSLLNIEGGQSSIEPIVAMMFTGKLAKTPSVWGVVGVTQGLPLMGDPYMGGDFDEANFDTVGYDSTAQQKAMSSLGERPLWRLNETFEYIDWSSPRLGSLAQPLALDDTQIVITVNPDMVSDDLMPSPIFPLPDKASGEPGVVYVDGERIEYFKMTRSGDTVTLSQLRRATRGTRFSTERRVTTIENGDGFRTTFTLLGGQVAASGIEVTIDTGTQVRSMVKDVNFTMQQVGNDLEITFSEAPPLNSRVLLGQSFDLVHEAGTRVQSGAFTTRYDSPFLQAA